MVLGTEKAWGTFSLELVSKIPILFFVILLGILSPLSSQARVGMLRRVLLDCQLALVARPFREEGPKPGFQEVLDALSRGGLFYAEHLYFNRDTELRQRLLSKLLDPQWGQPGGPIYIKMPRNVGGGIFERVVVGTPRTMIQDGVEFSHGGVAWRDLVTGILWHPFFMTGQNVVSADLVEDIYIPRMRVVFLYTRITRIIAERFGIDQSGLWKQSLLTTSLQLDIDLLKNLGQAHLSISGDRHMPSLGHSTVLNQVLFPFSNQGGVLTLIPGELRVR